MVGAPLAQAGGPVWSPLPYPIILKAQVEVVVKVVKVKKLKGWLDEGRLPAQPGDVVPPLQGQKVSAL